MTKKGRPSKVEGPRTTRERILLIATSLVSRRGVNNTSLRAISSEAGVSLAAVQYHFPTKQDLLCAIIDDLIVPFEQERSSAEKKLKDYYSQVIPARLDKDIKTSGLTGRILSGTDGEEEFLLDYLSVQIEAIIKNDRSRIRRGKKEGELRDIYPEALMALLGIALPLLSSSDKSLKKFLAIDVTTKSERNKLANGIVDIILYGIIAETHKDKA
jgi:AcrR family transcriptional regulator